MRKRLYLPLLGILTALSVTFGLVSTAEAATSYTRNGTCTFIALLSEKGDANIFQQNPSNTSYVRPTYMQWFTGTNSQALKSVTVQWLDTTSNIVINQANWTNQGSAGQHNWGNNTYEYIRGTHNYRVRWFMQTSNLSCHNDINPE